MTLNPSGDQEVLGIPTSFPGTFVFSLIQTEISFSGSADETSHDPAGAAPEKQPLPALTLRRAANTCGGLMAEREDTSPSPGKFWLTVMRTLNSKFVM